MNVKQPLETCAVAPCEDENVLGSLAVFIFAIGRSQLWKEQYVSGTVERP